MILLISPYVKVQDSVRALMREASEPVHVAASFRQALVLLRAQEYSAVVFDQALLDTEADESDAALGHLGAAIPVYLNFAICGPQRVVKELHVALQRRKREEAVARDAAQLALRNELKGSVTAMLLSCEMALRAPDLPGEAESKLRAVYDLALEMRGKFCAAE